jgi:hypothetical protein
MTTKRLLDSDNGMTTVLETDDLTKTNTIGYYQDCSPIFERNKQLATQDDGYTSHDRWRRRVASIPNIVLQIWCKQAGLPFLYVYRNWKRDPQVKAWLRKKIYDPDNAYVLTAPHSKTGGGKYVSVKAIQ